MPPLAKGEHSVFGRPDTIAECKMNEMGIKWKIEVVPRKEIDFTAGLQNHARVDALNQTRVTEMRAAMERGCVFPYPVFLVRGHKKVPIGGNHRLQAAPVSEQDIKGYVVVSDDLQVEDMLPRMLNRGLGDEKRQDEAVIDAVFAVDKYSWAPAEADRKMGLPDGATATALRRREVKTNLQAAGVTATIPVMALQSLGSLKNDNVQIAAGALVARAKMTGADAVKFVGDVRRARTEASQMAVVASYESQLPIPKPTDPPQKHKLNQRTKFIRILSSAERTFLPENSKKTTLAQYQITEATEDEKIRERLTELAKAIRALAVSRTDRPESLNGTTGRRRMARS